MSARETLFPNGKERGVAGDQEGAVAAVWRSQVTHHRGIEKALPHGWAKRLPLPEITFGELRDTFMRTAKSRSGEMFDYRHCMRQFHPILALVHNDPAIDETILGDQVVMAVDRIRHLRYQALLLH